MISTTLRYFALITSLIIINFFITWQAGYIYVSQLKNNQAITTTVQQKLYTKRVLLVPLDDRPPCTQFVVELAKLKNIEIILPPTHLLGKYHTPADRLALRNWLNHAIKQADAAIISFDMLVHGSLLASRLSIGNQEDIKQVIGQLKEIHQNNPKIPLYLFNIIPRLIIGDSDENSLYQHDMLQYSVLKDQVNIFENPKDFEKLIDLERQIPSKIIHKYNEMYEQNNRLNITLMNLVETGIIENLIIGQDDGKPFGIPNNNKRLAEYYLDSKPNLKNKVFITRGTDEVALTQLSTYTAKHFKYNPKVFVAYSDNAKNKIMPFMPHTVENTVQEKLHIAQGIRVFNPDEADFILYVYIGTKNSGKYARKATSQVTTWLDKGYKVALVDLSEDFSSDQTILPYLLESDTNLINLIAYAGWNTTSNSIGTAITQASLFSQAVKSQKDSASLINLHLNNLEFITARILDDWYYQKKVQPFINGYLHLRSINPYNLDTHYDEINDYISIEMACNTKYLLNHRLFSEPFTITTAEGYKQFFIADIKIECRLPWSRTFEIYIQPRLTFREVSNH